MIYACEHHDEILGLWRRQDLRKASLAHVDFHDDLRGLLVDRRRSVAYRIAEKAPGAAVDAGNFLAHAVVEERVCDVRWIHCAIGGRAWDAGIVRYESDVFALPGRLRHRLSRGREVPLRFEEMLLDDWNGLRAGERLSVDWDCFASILQDPGGIEQRLGGFLERLDRGPIPPDTYAAYSPEYCHPTFDRFNELVRELAGRFDQPVEWLGSEFERGRFHPTGVDAELPGTPWMRLVLALRRRGIF